MGGNNVKPANQVWWIPVVSDRGERFPNAKAAAAAVNRNHGAVIHAINTGHRCAGRKWERVNSYNETKKRDK